MTTRYVIFQDVKILVPKTMDHLSDEKIIEVYESLRPAGKPTIADTCFVIMFVGFCAVAFIAFCAIVAGPWIYGILKFFN